MFAVSVAVMSVDLGSEWMKMAIVKPGVPMEIVLNKYVMNVKALEISNMFRPMCSLLVRSIPKRTSAFSATSASCLILKCCVFFPVFRESRRKTPTAVCLKENERLFGDSALGMVSC